MRSRLSNKALTAERLHEAVNYDPETGIFTWRTKRRRVLVGSEVGSIKPNGYRQTVIDGRDYWLHRLAWFYVYGEWPSKSKEIDHINRIKSDNRITNLRLATRSENNHNRPAHADNTIGVKGVRKAASGWEARIAVNKRQLSLGLFPTLDSAVAAYNKAAVKYYGEFACEIVLPDATRLDRGRLTIGG